MLTRQPKLTDLELQILDALWQNGRSSIREILNAFPESDRPAYTTVQTTVYRLERKKVLNCVKRISNANIFEAAITRDEVERHQVKKLVDLLGGKGKLVMAHLIESGDLSLEDVREAEALLQRHAKKGKPK